MTQDEIIRMAREAGFESNSLGMTYTSGRLPELLKRFATLVTAAEREECAKVCDDELKEWGIFDSDVGNVSKAIRARGQA